MQLVNICNWLQAHPGNACTITEAVIASSFESLQNMVYWGENRELVGAEILKMALGILRRVSQMWLPTGLRGSREAPIWGNPYFPHFLNLPCAAFWSAKVIKKVSHLFKKGVLRDFADFCSECHIAPKRLHLYFQLRHAAAAQFPGLVVGKQDLLLEALLHSKTVNKLISLHYAALMRTPTDVRAKIL